MAKEKNRQIEGIRGLGCLMVVFYHAIYQYRVKICEQTPSAIMKLGFSWWGEAGVLLFLFISIWFILHKPSQSVMHTMRKRMLRLWPAYAVCCTIIFFLLSFFPLQNRTVGGGAYLLNLTMLNPLFNVDYVDGAHWYLTSLLSINLFVCVIEKYCEKWRNCAYLVWLLACLGLRFVPALGAVRTVFCAGYVGVVCFTVAVKNCTLQKAIDCQSAVLAVLGMGYMASIRGARYIVLMIGALVVFLLSNNMKCRFFEAAVWQKIASISYPLYLIHQNVIYVIQNQLNQLTNHLFPMVVSIVAVVIVTLGVVIVLAIINATKHRLFIRGE